MEHIPVLLMEVLKTLGDITGKTIVDCTFGAGGYTRAFLESGANVIAFDRDSSVKPNADAIAAEYGDRFQFINAPFSEISKLAAQYDAIVFDLGVSSMQIDTCERGFSFRYDAPLDMRMSREYGTDITAAELIERSTASELSKILYDFGDVKKCYMFANIIKDATPKTTFELKNLIYDPKDIAPIFQALRIAVNDELGEVQRALDAVPALLCPGGACICVTFHSLEDKLVKKTFREWTEPLGDPRLPIILPPDFKAIKTYRPSDAELIKNPRARSAHLRSVLKK